MSRHTSANWFGRATAWGGCYSFLNLGGILAAPAYGAVIAGTLGCGIAISISAGIWEYCRHGNLGTLDDLVDSFHHTATELVSCAIPLIPILAICCG